MEQSLSKPEMAQAFNEWMRRYIDEPERFAREFEAVGEYVADAAAGKVPSYGEKCAAYLVRLASELAAA